MRKLLLAAAFLGLAGCKQGINDRCQVDDDCDSSLLCFYTGSPNPSVGGQCEPMNFGGFQVDAGGDAGPRDASPIDGATSDAD